MLWKLLRGALRIHPLRLGLMVLSTAMGASIAASLSSVSLQMGDRLARELRSFGANIVVEPAVARAPGGAPAGPAWIEESDLPRLLAIFWRHNLVGLAPSLAAPATVSGRGGGTRALLSGVWFDRPVPRPGGEGTLRGGVVPLFPFWQVHGAWPASPGQAVLGVALARRLGAGPGDRVSVEADGRSAELEVSGLVRTGGFEDDQVMVELGAAQALLGVPGKVSRALVSAVTVPIDGFGRRDPAGMTPREREKWLCTPYVTSVARQVEQAVPGSRARPVWSLAEAEARVLSRLDVLVMLLAALTLGAAALAVASTFAARVMGRRAEIALMRACGASPAQVTLLLGAEVMAVGAAGGLVGAFLAAAMIRGLGLAVFGAPLEVTPSVLPLAMGGSLVAAALGAVWPVRRALSLDPAQELKEAG